MTQPPITSESPLRPVSLFTKEWEETLLARWAGEFTDDLVPTGFSVLDSQIGGLGASELTVIAARPSMGKSSFAQCLARNVAYGNRDDECVAFFSLEMSEQQILNNFIAQETGLNMSLFKRDLSTLNPSVLARYKKAVSDAIDRLDELNLFLDTTVGCTAYAIRDRIRELSQSYTPRLVVVDYLGLLQKPNAAMNLNEAIGEHTKTLHEIAIEFKCPVVALSQLNRSVEQDPQNNPLCIPELRHLRDSGNIEQDANNIWFLWRPAYYSGEKCAKEEKDLAYILVAKARQGARRVKLPLVFEEDLTRFSDVDQTRLSKLIQRGTMKY